MKGIILIFSCLILAFTGISMMLLGMQNYWFDTTLRHSYHQSIEYVMKLDTKDANYSIEGFNKRLKLMVPNDIKVNTVLLGINYYPKVFKVSMEATKPNTLKFKIIKIMMEEPEV